MSITKKELKELKELIKQVSELIDPLQEEDKLVINWNPEPKKRPENDDFETPRITCNHIQSKLDWFNKRLDKWIELAPGSRRGPKPKDKPNAK